MHEIPARRDFLKCLTAGAVAAAWPHDGVAQQPERQAFVYKTVDKLEIKADVYRAAGTGPRPVVMWIHGGALIMGGRSGIDGRLRDLLLKAGCTVVSVDYRLAPETKLPGILDDVRDACRWVREQGPKLFAADPDRLAVMGGSAGGYLTFTTGYRVEPRPKALVAFWGYGDLVGAWYSKPDPFYRMQPLVPEEEARAAVGKTPLAEAPPKNSRGRFYLYCRQNGLWPREVTGLDPEKQAQAFAPFMPLRNITAQYPPTLMIHGTKDTDVPYEQSVLMDQELKQRGVEHELLTVKDGGHGLPGEKPETIAKIHERAVAFVKKHLE